MAKLARLLSRSLPAKAEGERERERKREEPVEL